MYGTPYVHISVIKRKTAPLAAQCADGQHVHQVGGSISKRSLAANRSNEQVWEDDLRRRAKDYCFNEASSNSPAS